MDQLLASFNEGNEKKAETNSGFDLLGVFSNIEAPAKTTKNEVKKKNEEHEYLRDFARESENKKNKKKRIELNSLKTQRERTYEQNLKDFSHQYHKAKQKKTKQSYKPQFIDSSEIFNKPTSKKKYHQAPEKNSRKFSGNQEKEDRENQSRKREEIEAKRQQKQLAMKRKKQKEQKNALAQKQRYQKQRQRQKRRERQRQMQRQKQRQRERERQRQRRKYQSRERERSREKKKKHRDYYQDDEEARAFAELRKITGRDFTEQKYRRRDREQIIESRPGEIMREDRISAYYGRKQQEEDYLREMRQIQMRKKKKY